jgi:hypothetical protein
LQKRYILDEMRRTAAENGGAPLGHVRFFQETGIKVSDWHGKFWSRWGDAIKEAGFEPNSLQGSYPREFLFEKLAALCRELGRIPTVGEMKLRKRTDPTFPNTKVYERIGRKPELVAKLADYCRTRPEVADVLAMCATSSAPSRSTQEPRDDAEVEIGFVYLFKSGRYYKIGKSNAAGRREREIALQQPEPTTAVHTIRTDDPSGIEAYWHRRFEPKRLNGEWFNLSAADVKAFKRRKFM